MYPLMSVFRTSTGFLPGYGFAPAQAGLYDLKQPIILFRENHIYPVERVKIKYDSGFLLVTKLGFCGISDSLFDGHRPVAIMGGGVNDIDPYKTVDDAVVNECALRASLFLSRCLWDRAARAVSNLMFHEIRGKVYSTKEYYQSNRFILNFANLTKAQVYGWLYATIQCCWRLKSLKAGTDRVVEWYLHRTWWRDIILRILLALKIEFNVVQTGRSCLRVNFTRDMFHQLIAILTSVDYPHPIHDLACMDEVLPSFVTLLDKAGHIDINKTSATPDGSHRVTKLKTKVFPYKGLFVTFPEHDEQVDTNGFILDNPKESGDDEDNPL